MAAGAGDAGSGGGSGHVGARLDSASAGRAVGACVACAGRAVGGAARTHAGRVVGRRARPVDCRGLGPARRHHARRRSHRLRQHQLGARCRRAHHRRRHHFDRRALSARAGKHRPYAGWVPRRSDGAFACWIVDRSGGAEWHQPRDHDRAHVAGTGRGAGLSYAVQGRRRFGHGGSDRVRPDGSGISHQFKHGNVGAGGAAGRRARRRELDYLGPLWRAHEHHSFLRVGCLHYLALSAAGNRAAGFEQACSLARAATGAARPDVARGEDRARCRYRHARGLHDSSLYTAWIRPGLPFWRPACWRQHTL